MKTKLTITLYLAFLIITFCTPNSAFSLNETFSQNFIILDVYTDQPIHNGIGINKSSDIYMPGQDVTLYANVTSNLGPIPNTLVSFNVSSPIKQLAFMRTVKTDNNGIATFSFTIPWNYNGTTEAVMGTWTVHAQTVIWGLSAEDTLTFNVNWIVDIINMRAITENGTSSNLFTIGGDVGVELTLKNNAKSPKNISIYLSLYDELNQPHGKKVATLKILPNNSPLTIYSKIRIPSWMFPGTATLYSILELMLNEKESIPCCPEKSVKFNLTRNTPISFDFHDIAITDMAPSKYVIKKGEPLEIYVSYRNEGTIQETFNLTLYCNSTEIEKLQIESLEPYAEKTSKFVWNTSSFNPGKYVLKAEITQLPNEMETNDNTKAKEITLVISLHDIAILELTPTKIKANVGEIIPIFIKIANKGTEPENITLNLYYDSNTLESRNILNFTPGTEKTLLFTWNTSETEEGIYILKAELPPVEGEENLANNVLIYKSITLIAPYVPPPTYIIDLAVLNVSISSKEIYAGETVNITIKIKNEGNITVSFSLYLYANNSTIKVINIYGLSASQTKEIHVEWNTTNHEPGNYLIKAYIPPLPDETDRSDNIFINGILTIKPAPSAIRVLMIILLIIIALLLLSLGIYAYRKKRKKKAGSHLIAICKIKFITFPNSTILSGRAY